LGKSAPYLIWTLILAIGAGAALKATHRDGAHAYASGVDVAQALRVAKFAPVDNGADAQRGLRLAASMVWRADPVEPALLRSVFSEPAVEPASTAAIGPPDGATRLLKAAMKNAPAFGRPRAPPPLTALAALTDATSTRSITRTDEPTAYGALEAESFSQHRLTILQLGDSHTAADFFSGRVRERLQQVFGIGGDAYLVPGRPHVGVRSALFETSASDGWGYEALQKADSNKRFYLSGFNAVSKQSGALLSFRAREGRAYDRVEIAFLKQPGGGRAEVAIDGFPAGQVNLDGAADSRATLSFDAAQVGAPHGFREVTVKALDDGPVAVTGVDVGREGDGVSYVSLGFPGATVQLLQKLEADNIADDFRRLEPDVVVLAFGTNEGFNDNLDVAAYTRQYEQIVRKLLHARPGLRVVIVGPPDAARPSGVCHASGVGEGCASNAQISAGPGGGQCRYPVPPKLGLVREAQRKLAEKLGAYFWDWSSVMPGPCGAQVWEAASPPLMARDFVHMTLDGYKQSADRFADFLIPLIQGRQSSTHVVSND